MGGNPAARDGLVGDRAALWYRSRPVAHRPWWAHPLHPLSAGASKTEPRRARRFDHEKTDHDPVPDPGSRVPPQGRGRRPPVRRLPLDLGPPQAHYSELQDLFAQAHGPVLAAPAAGRAGDQARALHGAPAVHICHDVSGTTMACPRVCAQVGGEWMAASESMDSHAPAERRVFRRPSETRVDLRVLMSPHGFCAAVSACVALSRAGARGRAPSRAGCGACGTRGRTPRRAVRSFGRARSTQLRRGGDRGGWR